ncbi:MAG TPA: GrpB family protein [Streptosporangiaceae bacterium]|nr:GrpB family protein [Streptosporangiaceae bacterium]
MEIAVVDYDPSWVARFEVERADLARVLSPWLHGGIQHIGSTAVPGLAAKPILDVMAGVRDLRSAAAAIPVLQRLTYGHADHRPDALWFYKPASGGLRERTCQLHLTEPGSGLWRERLAFRDALRADAALAREYQDLKLRLRASTADLREYTAGKRAFVSAVLARCGIELAPR